MKIKVIAHLSHCLGSRSLILYWYSCQTSIYIVFNVISFEYIFVVIVYLYIFETLYSVIVVTSTSTLLTLLCFVHLFTHPVHSFARVILWSSWFLGLGGWFWGRRRFSTYFDIIGREKTFSLRSFDYMTVPPSILKCLFD
jgi:hypothetical protein